MAQFYVQRTEEDRCRNAVITEEPITVAGLSFNGTVLEFTGVVQTVENDRGDLDYPLLVTMRLSK